MSIYDPERQLLKVTEWHGDRGVVVDQTGFAYPIELAKLSDEFQGEYPPKVNEILEGIARGPGDVIGLLRLERKQFETVGPSPDIAGWNPHRGTPGDVRIR